MTFICLVGFSCQISLFYTKCERFSLKQLIPKTTRPTKTRLTFRRQITQNSETTRPTSKTAQPRLEFMKTWELLTDGNTPYVFFFFFLYKAFLITN